MNQYQQMHSKTTKNAPLVDVVGSHSSGELLKQVDSSTPEARPPMPIYNGTDDHTHRLKMATRRKNGNLPSLNYQQRNRMSGSVQNLPNCNDNLDGLVQLEKKLCNLMIDLRTKINPATD